MGKYIGTTTYSMNEWDFDKFSNMQLQLMRLFEDPDGDIRINITARSLGGKEGGFKVVHPYACNE